MVVVPYQSMPHRGFAEPVPGSAPEAVPGAGSASLEVSPSDINYNVSRRVLVFEQRLVFF